MSETLDLNIKTSGDGKFEVSVNKNASVLDLKKAIAEKMSVEVERQRLIYSGKVLKDDKPLEEYKVQNGHTIHLVKGAAKTTSASGTSISSNAQKSATETTNTNSATTSGATSAAASSTAAGVPSNIAAGQGSFNPLADLTGARYAGYAQLPSASMFGPDGGMNGMPNPEDLQRMMSDPLVQEQMQSLFNNPQMLDFLIQQSPQLRAMGPQAREFLQSPIFRQMISNPDLMASMLPMAQGRGANNTPSFPAPGSATGEDPTPNNESTNSNANTSGANPFTNLFPGGAPNFDPLTFASMLGGGATGAGASAAPVDNRPPEERYESQLRQLNDMGFFDFDRNVEALRRTGGSVQGAIEQLLSNP